LLKTSKTLRILVFTLLTATLLMAVANNYVQNAKAQTNDTVTLIASVGGSYTNPDGSAQAPGPYTYADGSTQTFTAVPGDGFIFAYWTIVTADYQFTDTDNPLSLAVNESEIALQATFTPETLIPPAVQTNSATNAIVVVIAGVGGTTSPAPGTYELANAASLDLTAIPNNGWQFDNWVIAGTPLSHGAYAFTDTPTNNPYNVNHGYGNTYSYEAVFSPISTSTSSTPKVAEFSSAAAIILLMALVIVAFGTYTYTKKAKK
jgi:hypothetical protein